MTSEKTQRLSLQLLYAKGLLMLLAPGFAWAAEQTIQQVARRGSIEAVTLTTWAFLLAFSMLGWAVSELDKVAELWNTDGRTRYELMRERLTLLKTVAASLAAGMLVYFLGQEAPAIFLRVIGIPEAAPGGNPVAIPEMVLFVLVAGAGYMGARWFAWLEARFFAGRP